MSAQLERLLKRLDSIPKEVKKAVEPALLKSGQELVDTMKLLAPEDTGALKDSITMTPPGQSTPPYSQPGGSRVAKENEILVTAGNSKVRYPHLVEYGTAQAPAQAFFWVSFRLTRAKIQRRLRRAISAAVKKGWQQ